jgi:hypothetical protein
MRAHVLRCGRSGRLVGTAGRAAAARARSTPDRRLSSRAASAVAKHGNRAVSSTSLGGRSGARLPARAPPQRNRALDRRARSASCRPTHRPAMRHGPVRREPAPAVSTRWTAGEPGARAQVVGVYDHRSCARSRRCWPTARVGPSSSTARRIDELSPVGPNLVCEVVDGGVRSAIDPPTGRPALRPVRAARRLAGRQRRGDPSGFPRRERRQALGDPAQRRWCDRGRRPCGRPARGTGDRP